MTFGGFCEKKKTDHLNLLPERQLACAGWRWPGGHAATAIERPGRGPVGDGPPREDLRAHDRQAAGGAQQDLDPRAVRPGADAGTVARGEAAPPGEGRSHQEDAVGDADGGQCKFDEIVDRGEVNIFALIVTGHLAESAGQRGKATTGAPAAAEPDLGPTGHANEQNCSW